MRIPNPQSSVTSFRITGVGRRHYGVQRSTILHQSLVHCRTRADRSQLRRALAELADGDVLMFTRLDRFARSTRDLLNMVEAIAAKGAGIRSLAEAWLDTTTPHGRLMLIFFAGMAEFERDLIRARTTEDRTRAKTNGVKFVGPIGGADGGGACAATSRACCTTSARSSVSYAVEEFP
jgi:DNA invertase Pin-like site-specific DNA recombinase